MDFGEALLGMCKLSTSFGAKTIASRINAVRTNAVDQTRRGTMAFYTVCPIQARLVFWECLPRTLYRCVERKYAVRILAALKERTTIQVFNVVFL